MASITCEPKQLANALAAVKPAVSRNSAIQALAGVRITTNIAGHHLTTTDMDVLIRRGFPGERDGDMDVVVSHALLEKAVKSFAKHESVTVEQGSEEVIVRSGARKIGARPSRLEDWPEMPKLGGAEIVAGANGEILASALERVSKFASKDDTRPILTGVRVENEDGELVLVATDSYRLMRLQVSELDAHAGGFTIPARGLKIAAKLMRKEQKVTLRAYGQELSNGYAIIEWPGTLITVRLCHGQYPNHQQLIPNDFAQEVTVSLPELRDACDASVQFITKNAPIRLYVNGVVKLHGSTPDVGSFEQILEGAKVSERKAVSAVRERMGDTAANGLANNEPEEFEIGFNPEFLREIAHDLNGSEFATVKLISPMRPALIETKQGAERHLLMPIRLNV